VWKVWLGKNRPFLRSALSFQKQMPWGLSCFIFQHKGFADETQIENLIITAPTTNIHANTHTHTHSGRLEREQNKHENAP